MIFSRQVKISLVLIVFDWIHIGCQSREHPYETIDHEMDIYHDIERALYFDGSRSERRKFIAKTFDLKDPNPSYTFVLPDEGYRRLIMKRTDFRRPVFPNMTRMNVKLGRMAARQSFEREQSGRSPVRVNRLTAGSPGNPFSNGEDVALQNVQTERAFIEYMQGLNERAEEYFERINSKGHRKRSKKSHRIKDESSEELHRALQSSDEYSEWEDFGLTGWSGEIIAPSNLRKETSNEKLRESDLELLRTDLKGASSEETDQASAPLEWNFLDESYVGEPWDLPGKVRHKGVPEFEQLKEKYGSMLDVLDETTSPRWPIVRPRGAHKNQDVYIARANDPFGYSTKWEFRSRRNTTSSRQKRGISELYSMLKCATGCDPLILKGYGCYCGFLGAGSPADGIDRCCQAHDQCYGRTNCPRYLQYFIPYVWKCYNGRPLCAVENGEWGHCATQMCKCDLALSACARRYRCPRRRQICHSNGARMFQNYLKII